MFLFKKIYASAAASVFVAAAVCSCDVKNEIINEDKELADFTPITEIQEGRKNFYLIVKDLDDQYWKVLIRGAAAAGNEQEVNVYMSGSADETQIEQQVKLVQKAVDNGADAVIIAPAWTFLLFWQIQW